MDKEWLKSIEPLIEAALHEDVQTGDVTTNLLIPAGTEKTARLIAKAGGVIAGLPVVEAVFRKLDPNIVFSPGVSDGDRVEPGQQICMLRGSYRALLTGERLALNFLQRMSGIATETARYVEVLRGYKTQILDTRKTVPGLRMLDKYAVKAGGGANHRIGLFDMVLIKDNHIAVAGGITKAVASIRKSVPEGMKIEVETTTLDEVHEALAAGVDIIMLDNMDLDTMARAVSIIGGKAKVEASGNMTLERVRPVAATGVDFISVGALTHSVRALDISQKIE
ncbi:MAG TPA: carboxylating nicotinate-nucleotide diphosphorylase [Prolixibacteraceae bacterium]|nr:carboxylating nicotinate-nucleotide diphosphorylase [Prolixibacteraceae bacterium]